MTKAYHTGISQAQECHKSACERVYKINNNNNNKKSYTFSDYSHQMCVCVCVCAKLMIIILQSTSKPTAPIIFSHEYKKNTHTSHFNRNFS